MKLIDDDDEDQKGVTISKSFDIMITEVTPNAVVFGYGR